VLDVGTGSGAIAISIALELPGSVVTAVDLSPDALALAAQNAATHDVQIEFRASDLLAAVAEATFDLVIANLPYVAEGAAVDAEVERFEPALAVFAPDHGRALIERLLTSVSSVLAPGGVVALELSDTQSSWAVARLAELGFEDAAAERDLAGVERLAFAQRPAS
jgi:release factor glutamine methyltransferase